MRLLRYTSEVYLKPGEQVISKVFDSTLFDHLDSTWDFKVGPSPSSTWLTFSVDFGFKSPLYRSVAAVFFEEVGLLSSVNPTLGTDWCCVSYLTAFVYS